jgi:drug/metabolite transporter (DMT)-like permease
MVLLATFLVGGSFILSKKLAGTLHPISLTLLRFGIATLVLSPFVLNSAQKRSRLWGTFPRASIIGFFYVSYFIFFFKALEYTDALSTGTLYTLVPFTTGVLCIFFFKERIGKTQLFIYLLGIVGTLIVVFKGDWRLLVRFSLGRGEIIFLAAILSMALYSIFMKIVHRKDDDMSVLVFMTLLSGSIWLFLAKLFFNVPLAWQHLRFNDVNYLLYLAVIATFITSYLYQKSTILIGPKKVMAYIYLSPASIAFLLYFFEGAHLSLEMWGGIVMSSVATFLLLIL